MGKEILEQISKSMIETNRKEVDRLTKQAIQDGIPAIEILEEGLIPESQ